MSSQDGRLTSALAAPKVVVATTVALSFISFWRGASIVLSDLASSMFYAGGAAEQAIGKAAPWFVLGVMLFSFAVRSVYMESCSMYVRGGVYVVVHDSMGPVMAKLSVSALVFDYILTGPISVVSAGQYLGALLNEISDLMHQSYHINVDLFAAGVAVLITLYFWWENVKGVHESERQGAAHYADHLRHGGDFAHLVPAHHADQPPDASAAGAGAREYHVFSRRPRLAGGGTGSGSRFQ